jgi:hypothetical protein
MACVGAGSSNCGSFNGKYLFHALKYQKTAFLEDSQSSVQIKSMAIDALGAITEKLKKLKKLSKSFKGIISVYDENIAKKMASEDINEDDVLSLRQMQRMVEIWLNRSHLESGQVWLFCFIINAFIRFQKYSP